MSSTCEVLPSRALAWPHARVDWRHALLAANVILLLASAVLLRGWQLGNLPGLNGDEAWSGVQAQRLLAGEPIAWRTPTGNPVNPFFLLPLAALHALFPPSVALLRLPALLSGLAALVANFWLCRRTFDERTAWLSTAVLAVLPVDIVYSRFAWDASQTLLATVLVLYLSLDMLREDSAARRPLLCALLAFAAAIWVHPTNVFCGWLLAIPLVWTERGRLAEWVQKSRQRRGFAAGATVAAVVGVFGLATIGWLLRQALGAGLMRAVSPPQWGQFGRAVVKLFSGSTVFEFIAGPAESTSTLGPLDWATLCVVAAAALGLWQLLARRGATLDRALVAATFAMAGSFFLVAGPAALAPHFERYGLFLIAPGALLIARGIGAWLEPERGFAAPVTALVCVMAWMSLWQTYNRYFAFIQTSGGQSHYAFRTAELEPKQLVWDHIRNHSDAEQPIAIVADGWWSYWPMAYLAAPHDRVRVLDGSNAIALAADAAAADADLPRARREGAVWFVAFAGTPDEAAIDQRLAELDCQGRKTVIADFSGRPLLTVVEARPKSEGIR